MKTKHTPGPWKIVARQVMEDGSVYPAHIVGGPTELEICWLEGQAVADLAVEDPEHWDKPKVDGPLIAAAPELLEAAVAFMEGEGNCKEVRDMFRAAIAKARGES